MRISVMLAAAATVVVLSASFSAPALADAKGEFQKGCTSGGGSYGEDVNGVFCNSSGGVHIACDDKITHCTATSYTDQPKKPFGPRGRQFVNGATAGLAPTPSPGPKLGGHQWRPLSLGTAAPSRLRAHLR